MKTQTKAKRPARKTRSLSDHSKRLIERRKEVQKNYYYRTRKLSPVFLARQEQYKEFAETLLKLCIDCGERKSPDEFYSVKTGAYRLTDDCKECRSARALANYYRRKGQR